MTAACAFEQCDGVVLDGFCSVCGREPAQRLVLAADASDPQPGAASVPAPGASSVGAAVPAEALPAASRPASLHVGGYSALASRPASRRPQVPAEDPGTRGTATGRGSSSARGSGTARGSGSARGSDASERGSRGTRGGRGSGRGGRQRQALGAGLVAMPAEPARDPLELVLPDPRVPDGKCFCPACDNRVNPSKRFCAKCGTEYNFRPTLRDGDVVAGQYEIRGPIAYGGVGWIYLGVDTKLNRWVVLKGLLNSKDQAAAAAAAVERQFLASVKHGKIVGVYNVVVHNAASYIVMEYVNGRTLRALRKEHGPLPPAQAISYILGILPAFAYLHGQGLVYCDFKANNVMLEGDDVKLIDLGAVRRIGDPDGDVYGTVGHKAPEADHDPVEESDLYTIGRALAVLLMDFDNTGRYRDSLPPPNELLHVVPPALLGDATPLGAGLPDGRTLPDWLTFDPVSRAFAGKAPAHVTVLDVVVDAAGPGGELLHLPVTLRLPLAANESLYRFLLKATAPDLQARFGSADGMAAQLRGVLREIVAREGEIPATESPEFLAERAKAGAGDAKPWQRLPPLRLRTDDPAAAEVSAALATPDLARRAEMLAAAMRRRPDSAEAALRLAEVRLERDAEAEAVMPMLDQALAAEPHDWRPDWVCGLFYLSKNKPDEAIECFDRIYGELPGESAPKLALALALEAAGRMVEAAGLYETVSRTDPVLTFAAFGLARCCLDGGDRDGAVAAYRRVPPSSSFYTDAQLAAARTLIGGQHELSTANLVRASEILLASPEDDIRRHETEAALALAAAAAIAKGQINGRGLRVLDTAGRPRDLRFRAEAALRTCARLAPTVRERTAFIEQSEDVRPRTLF